MIRIGNTLIPLEPTGKLRLRRCQDYSGNKHSLFDRILLSRSRRRLAGQKILPNDQPSSVTDNFIRIEMTQLKLQAQTLSRIIDDGAFILPVQRNGISNILWGTIDSAA